MNADKQLFVLTRQYARDQLIELRNHEQFYCPQCQEPVHLKIGQVIIPHFAHRKQSNCQQTFSEGETAVHLLGKHQLYEMFKKLQLNVQLEPYLPILAQRPDVLVEKEQQQFAIEFQCSTIPIPQMETRTIGYLQVNMIPIWILKTPKDKQSYKDGIQQIKLSPFKQQFIIYIQNHAHIITFDPETAAFLYFSHLMPMGGYRFIANVKHLSIESQHFPFLNVKEPSEDEFRIYWQLWKKNRQQFLKRRLFISKNGVQDPFLRACYFMGCHVENLPLFIGIPMSKTSNFSVFEAEWQMVWLLFLLEKGYDFNYISSYIIDEFRKMYPELFINKHAVKSLQNYNEILKKLGITHINSIFDETALYRYLYVQFLAKH
ncbi:MAG TPA: competence protein CoiA family protein [Rummeliibacillus sp.]|nr:competence protein CoiA family protein [Rummeliibacillus sp.]